ncbi:MAG: SEC-C metal-binding domain-containing protein, partial [Clostridia bacterium]|nr:SEC-C metal-binding domain-containing protein [Clostridia bacterium]
NPPIDQDAKDVRTLGGLHVIGTERHEARRIDNQLRGRSGRQGDPGSTQFFLSLEDDLMRIFGGDKIKNLMTALNVPEDEPIQAGMISGAIESAQTKIEGFNFDSRHHLLEYDDVINKHRDIVYKKRKEFLYASNLKEIILEMIKKAGLSEGEYLAKEQEIGEAQMRQLEKMICLRVLDVLWQEHLSFMDHVKDSVRLRAYAGRDPLVEYKSEGRKAFSKLLETIDSNIIENILKSGIQKDQPQKNRTVIAGAQEVGRNDPCPCGSGKKYKKCHGK